MYNKYWNALIPQLPLFINLDEVWIHDEAISAHLSKLPVEKLRQETAKCLPNANKGIKPKRGAETDVSLPPKSFARSLHF